MLDQKGTLRKSNEVTVVYVEEAGETDREVRYGSSEGHKIAMGA